MRKEKASFLCLLSDDCELDHRRMDNVINEFVENAPIKGIKIKYGIYKNIDKNLSIATIYDYASMAAETVMEDYNHDYAYYTDELAQKRLYNQMIENDFTDALKNKEFIISLCIWITFVFTDFTEKSLFLVQFLFLSENPGRVRLQVRYLDSYVS